MTDSDETNHLLREIRDILAAQESKYEQRIKRTHEMYAEQIQTYAQERKKAVRELFAWGMKLFGLLLVGLLFVLWKLLSQ